MSIFAAPVFDATVVYQGQEMFKGQGAARMWAEKVAKELKTEITVEKIGTGWVLRGQVDGQDVTWGIYGQRLSRIEAA
ncbi:hypothetical protein G4G28_21890 [Massilia sp. Dwa41.01b]|uniref:hypothetical protein n=1 Tax=unclassified Massilia TaxID=2609279 RepID=UPI001600A5E2|nr:MULTISPECIES: hypothetical protein [unclassified Massilia]QNA90487.1 hypothetical protein G4G28_21890 [Massilia sp. Dwa41.01b]QNA97717.1 hypothetical protein G4G31_00970 [Massilia sp. Se16.2.3]